MADDSSPNSFQSWVSSPEDSYVCVSCMLNTISSCKQYCDTCCATLKHCSAMQPQSKKRKKDDTSFPVPIPMPQPQQPTHWPGMTPANMNVWQQGQQYNIQLQILNSDDHPYPMFWIRPDRLHPDPVLIVHNFQWDENNIIVMVIAFDTTTNQPIQFVHLVPNTECIDADLTSALRSKYEGNLHAVRFKQLKIGTTTRVPGISSSKGVKLRLKYALFSKHVHPPMYICDTEGQDILLFNRRPELPAPCVQKVVPNILIANRSQDLTLYAQLLTEGKGKITMGWTYLQGNHTLEETWIPQRNFTNIEEVHCSEWHRFKARFTPTQTGYYGFALRFGGLSDNKDWGTGRIVYVSNVTGSAENYDLVTDQQQFSENNKFFGNSSFGGQNPSFGSSPQNPFSGGSSGNISTGGHPTQNNLFNLALSGATEQVQAVLNKGINPNSVDTEGNGALHYAAKGGHEQIVGIALAKGVDIDLQNNASETALHIAAREGHLDFVRALIKSGINADLKDDSEATALHYAAALGHLELVKVLMDNTGELDVPDVSSTPLIYAVRRGHLRVVEYISKYFDDCGMSLDSVDSEGRTALHWACLLGRLDMVVLLLKAGSSLEVRDLHEETALFLAVKSNSEEIVQLLLDAKARCDVWNEDNLLPIHFARTDTLRALIRAKTKENSPRARNVFVARVPETYQTRLEFLEKQNQELQHQVSLLTKQLEELKVVPVHSPVTTPPPVVQEITTTTSSSSDELQASAPSFSSPPLVFNFSAPPREPIPVVELTTVASTPPLPARPAESSYEIKTTTGKVLGKFAFPRGTTLSAVRDALAQDESMPQKFSFWFEDMNCEVEEHQEEKLKVEKVKKLILSVIPSSPLEYWNSQYTETEQVPIDRFIDDIKNNFRAKKEIQTVFEVAMKEFFEIDLSSLPQTIRKNKYVTLQEFSIFCSLFGPLENLQEHVFQVYREQFFHGFLTHDEALKRLKDTPGGYLIRYSTSDMMKQACFVLEVNKGRVGKDMVQSYYVRYFAEREKFAFHNKSFTTFREFVQIPEFKEILKIPVARYE